MLAQPTGVGFTQAVAYLCRVKAGANLAGVEDKDALCRIAEGLALHTVQHEQALRAVWAARKRAVGSEPKWPLTSAFGDEDVHWVEGTKSTYVRAPKVSSEPAKDTNRGTLAAHYWVQLQLADLGRRLGDSDVKMECPSDGTRIDVRWGDSGLAWEVDFTPKPRSEQETRDQQMHLRGLSLVSVIDTKDQRPQLAHLPRMAVRGLSALAESPNGFRWNFAHSYVDNAVTLRVEDGGWYWQQWRTLTVVAFCRDLITGRLVYGASPLGNRRHVWLASADVETNERLNREADDRSRSEREAVQTRERTAAAEQAIAARRKALERRQKACASRLRLLQEEGPTFPSTGSVLRDLDSSAEALGEDAVRALKALRQAVEAYQRSWTRFVGFGGQGRALIDACRSDALTALLEREKEFASRLAEDLKEAVEVVGM